MSLAQLLRLQRRIPLIHQLMHAAQGKERPNFQLNRAVAVAEVAGPAAALALVDPLPLERLHVYHAVRADLLRRLGRFAEAADAYAAAVECTSNAAEVAFLEARRADVTAVGRRASSRP